MAISFNVKNLLGLKPSSSELKDQILAFAAKISAPESATPEVKSYSDAVYFNYFRLGLSLLFKPINGYKPSTGLTLDALRGDDLVLDCIDMYNPPEPKSAAASKVKPTYSAFPIAPLVLTLADGGEKPDKTPRADTFEVSLTMTGKDFVENLGEPDRKGGGAGPSSGSIGIWCEWSKDGIMVEFGGDESRGPKAWEQGKDAIWKVVSVFPPSKQ